MTAEFTTHDIRDGDVLAFRAKGLIAALVRFRTLSRVSHVGFAFWVKGRLAVIEAREGRGVRIFPIDKYLKDPDLQIDWHELHDERYRISRETLVESALSHWGKRYASPWQFIRSWGLITRRMADRLGWATDTNPERFFCSEYVMHCLRNAGYQGEDYLDPADTSPGDIVELPCLHRRGRLA